MRNRILLPVLSLLLLLASALPAQTTQPVRPDVNRVVGWFNHGAEVQTPLRNIDFINPAPRGFAGSIVEQQLSAFADAGWKRCAFRCPYGTTTGDAGSPLGVIRFEQIFDARDQGFGWLASSYRQMWARVLAAHPGFEEIDYVGSPETLFARESDPLNKRLLDALTDQLLNLYSPSIAFDNTSGVAFGSYSQRVFSKMDVAGRKVYLEAIPLASCPHLFPRPFFIQETFDETVEGQQATGHQADWAATRQQLSGERICILDQPPAGATWDIPSGVTQAHPWVGPNHDAWLAAANKILSRGDTVAVDPIVIMALWPTR